MRKAIIVTTLALLVAATVPAAAAEPDPFTVQRVFCRFPLARVIPLDDGNAWGMLYADIYGKVHLRRATTDGWKSEWECPGLGSKVRNFVLRDMDMDGSPDIVIATFGGRILIHNMYDYSVDWENLEDRFNSIAAFEVANIDGDPQPEMIILADGRLHILDGRDKSRQWMSERSFEATEILVENVDQDDQLEIVFNSGIILDTRFFSIELEWGKAFGERIAAYDMNDDGVPDIVGEFSDYSLRIFDVRAKREVW
ncbi:MAG: hypothetical protein JW876_08530 [Candidatus Krumholzibacteriota bacterium]|nr:hypothetical protein [Candidatus Krumholzibacteriota bacterium]